MVAPPPRRRCPGWRSSATFYSSPEFDRLVAGGNEATSNAEAVAMSFPVEQSVFSEHVSDVKVDIFGRVEAAEVTVND